MKIIGDFLTETTVAESAEHVCVEAEDALEQVDASDAMEVPWAGVSPSVQAALLQDGRCLVHIVREDGAMRAVIIDPL